MAPVHSYSPTADVTTITSSFPIPGMGCVPINAFVLAGKEPILVDTGAVVERDAFMAALRTVIDPAELRWLWLTHPDPDHIGCLHALLSANPKLRLITTFLGVGIMSLSQPPPLDRVHFLNPGERLRLPDRTLTAFKPPSFDNPATTGFYDDKTRVLFSSDCFGALLANPPENAAELSDKELRDGQIFWATVDAPWLHKADTSRLATELQTIRHMDPSMILSSHLPAADARMTDRLLATLADVPAARPFVGPDQAALEQMLKQMPGGPQG
jgi:flavorubredoxin